MENNTTLIVGLIIAGAAGVYFFFIRPQSKGIKEISVAVPYIPDNYKQVANDGSPTLIIPSTGYKGDVVEAARQGKLDPHASYSVSAATIGCEGAKTANDVAACAAKLANDRAIAARKATGELPPSTTNILKDGSLHVSTNNAAVSFKIPQGNMFARGRIPGQR